MKYRGRTEIIDSILQSVENRGATRTHIMYSAYLSYTQLKQYLTLLEKRQLIAFDEHRSHYVITEKGVKFRNSFEEISELVPSAEKRNGVAKGANGDGFSH